MKPESAMLSLLEIGERVSGESNDDALGSAVLADDSAILTDTIYYVDNKRLMISDVYVLVTSALMVILVSVFGNCYPQLCQGLTVV